MARVLIIDDDVPFRQALAKHFEVAGHEVKQAADGDAGMRACASAPADVVLVDIFMPGQGGLRTIDRLRLEWPGVKIIAMSGVTSAGSLDVEGHAIALGAHRFVGKPFEGAAMVALVEGLVAGGADPPSA
jgi:DNA-binding response OmpR family regulator